MEACCCFQGNRMMLLKMRRSKNKGKIMQLGSGTLRHSLSNIYPQRDFTLSLPSSHLPTSCHISISIGPQRGSHYKCSPQTRPCRVAWLVLQVPDLLNARRTDAKIILLQDTPWAGHMQPQTKRRDGKKNKKLQEGREEQRKKST